VITAGDRAVPINAAIEDMVLLLGQSWQASYHRLGSLGQVAPKKRAMVGVQADEIITIAMEDLVSSRAGCFNRSICGQSRSKPRVELIQQ
jgi:hypothetical protein